jgi:hypothetical protein
MEQTRNNAQSVTQVPVVPLFLLLGLKMLYCFAVLIRLRSLVLYGSTGDSIRHERLTLKGLPAAYFGQGASHQKVEGTLQ